MKSNFRRIVKSYKKAQKEYNKDFKSDRWERGYKKRNDLFKFKNLKNFRNNSLSFGLDTRTGSLKNQKLLYEEIKRKLGIFDSLSLCWLKCQTQKLSPYQNSENRSQ